MAIQTRKSNPFKPVRALVYGVEGVGKSTLGAKSDRPIFISPEGGTDQLRDVDGQPVEELMLPDQNAKDTLLPITSWAMVRRGIKLLISEAHDYKTLVLDSADWLELLAHKEIVGTSGKSIITVDKGYGAGYKKARDMFAELLEDLSVLREKRNMNIIFTAHAHVKAVKDPDSSEDYDAFEIKCHEFVSSLLREWVDALLFCRFRTFTKQNEDSGKARAYGDGSRVIHTVKQPAFQAKNRYGMPPEFDFTEEFWKEIMLYSKKNGILPAPPETVEEVDAEIATLQKLVTDEKTSSAIATTLEKCDTLLKKQQVRNRLRVLTAQKETKDESEN